MRERREYIKKGGSNNSRRELRSHKREQTKATTGAGETGLYKSQRAGIKGTEDFDTALRDRQATALA